MKTRAKPVATQSSALVVKSGVRAGSGHPARHGQSPNHNAIRLKVKTQIKSGHGTKNGTAPLWPN